MEGRGLGVIKRKGEEGGYREIGRERDGEILRGEGRGREVWMMDEEREEREYVYVQERGREMKGGRVHGT